MDGKRSIIYVKQQNTETPAFMLREVELGPSLGDSYVILSGLNDGEEIVTNGAYIIDASAQLSGKQSMMNETAGRAVTGHEGHNMGHDMQSVSAKGEHAMLKVQGLCEMCKDRIEKSAKSVKGVSSASWDLNTKLLHLDFDPAITSVDQIEKAVAKAGHDTENYKTDQATYDALPACCKYRS